MQTLLLQSRSGQRAAGWSSYGMISMSARVRGLRLVNTEPQRSRAALPLTILRRPIRCFHVAQSPGWSRIRGWRQLKSVVVDVPHPSGYGDGLRCLACPKNIFGTVPVFFAMVFTISCKITSGRSDLRHMEPAERPNRASFHIFALIR